MTRRETKNLSAINGRRTFLIVSQTFVPDPAAVGRHMADVAFEMAARGHRVLVYASDTSYETGETKYPRHEFLRGVEIRRIPFSHFGKKSIPIRVFGTASFMTQVFFRMLFKPRLSGIFFSTSPPLVGFVVTIVGTLKRVKTAYWAMDLNPDQLIAMGKIKATSFRARFLSAVNKFILRRTKLIVALDRFMAQRLLARGDYADKLMILPPWSDEETSESIPHSQNPFRQQHNPGNKFVVMYSGNHTPANPLTTLLDAAVALKDDATLQFMFIGGGLGKKQVEHYRATHSLPNVLSLPYQDPAVLKYSLSTADIHIVSLGPDMIGIVHPCKVYGAMQVGRPILFLGPKPSHVSDLLDEHEFGLHVSHGDTAAAIAAIKQLQATPEHERDRMGFSAQRALEKSLTKSHLCAQLCTRLEDIIGKP